jgi:hypothetical protein
MQPLLDEITTALTRWGEAATAASAPDAPDTAKIALAGAAFRVRVALESATATLGAAVAGEDMPECAAPARDEAVTFLGELTSSSDDLLADDSASPDDVQAVIQQATDGLPALTEAVTTACG